MLLDEPDDGDGGRPEVHRGELRQILLDSLPAGTVRWGSKVTGVRALGDGRHEVTFADGTHRHHRPAGRRGRRLVAGPAAALRRRPRLHRHRRSSRPTCSTPTPGTPARPKAVGAGCCSRSAPGKGILAHRETDGSLHIYVALTKPQDWFAGIDFTDAAAATARIARGVRRLGTRAHAR